MRPINLQMHAAGGKDPSYFSRNVMMNDYTSILGTKNAKGITKEQAQHFKPHFNKETYLKYESIVDYNNVRNQLRNEERK